eukprot:181900_1
MDTDQLEHQNCLKWIHQITNDYELAIRISKELEYYLRQYFNATGTSLGEKITSVERTFNTHQGNDQFLAQLVRNLRWLVTIRNKVAHNRSYHKIEDKHTFITTFERSYIQLKHQKLWNDVSNNSFPIYPYHNEKLVFLKSDHVVWCSIAAAKRISSLIQHISPAQKSSIATVQMAVDSDQKLYEKCCEYYGKMFKNPTLTVILLKEC